MATFSRKNRQYLYTRITVPERLRIVIGKREFWKSLGTADTGTARYRALQLKASAHRLFKILTEKRRSMTQAQIEALVSKWLSDALDEAETDRAVCSPITEAQRENVQESLDAALDDSHEALLSGDHRRVTADADDLLQAAGLPTMDHAKPDFARLCRRLLRARIDYIKVESARWDGDYTDNALPRTVLTNPPPSPLLMESPSSPQ